MKFLGKAKDYYDYQAHIWGVDEKIIYDRSAFWDPDRYDYEGMPVHLAKTFELDNEMYLTFKVKGEDYEFNKHLVVCGKVYPLVLSDIEGRIYPETKTWMSMDREAEPERKWEIYRPDHHVFVKEKENDWVEALWKTRFYSWQSGIMKLEIGEEVEALKELSKMVHQPIFLISKMETTNRWAGRQSTKFTVQPHYPLTSSMGLGQLISADRLYQDVGYWLSNVINPSPDIMPDGKPPQTDLEKVVSHGFDKKVSFRKRKPAG